MPLATKLLVNQVLSFIAPVTELLTEKEVNGSLLVRFIVFPSQTGELLERIGFESDTHFSLTVNIKLP